MGIYVDNNISILRASNNYDYLAGNVDSANHPAYKNLFYPYLLDSAQNEKFPSILISEDNGWKYKNCTHRSGIFNNISNAFCFSGQNISIKIDKFSKNIKIDNNLFFIKNNFSIVADDLFLQTSESLLDIDSDYCGNLVCDLNIPYYDNDFYTQFGVFSIIILKTKITSSYYFDSNLENRVDMKESVNYIYLQLLVYSGAMEISEVSGEKINILKNPINLTDSLTSIYQNTNFYDLDDKKIPLTEAQKIALVADQAAALFISQHPVITADFYPSGIVGFGCDPSTRTKKDNKNGESKEVELHQDRLFNMALSYRGYNYVSDIEYFVNDFNQSNQVIRDPVRTLGFDGNGKILKSFGDNGILFDPYSYNTVASNYVFPTSQKINVENRFNDATFSFKDELGYSFGNQSSNLIINIDTKYDYDYAKIDMILSGGTTITQEGKGVINFDVSELNVIDGIKCVVDIYDGVDKYSFYCNPISRNNSINNIYARQSSMTLVVFYDYKSLSDFMPCVSTLEYSYDDSTWVESKKVSGNISNKSVVGMNKAYWDMTEIDVKGDKLVKARENKIFIRIKYKDLYGDKITPSIVVPVEIVSPYYVEGKIDSKGQQGVITGGNA
jgi:hypothetical protein